MDTDDTKKENTENQEENFTDVEFVDSTEDGDALPSRDVVKKLREENKTLRAEKEEYLTGWQRAKADYVNLQKDEENKRKDLRTYITSTLVEDLLPALDSFDMAMSNREAWEKVDANWRSGIEYIHKQFLQSLENNNVKPINTIGVPFDANMHEAVENVETKNKEEDHLISSIVQSGYKIGDKIIRPARVRVFEFKN